MFTCTVLDVGDSEKGKKATNVPRLVEFILMSAHGDRELDNKEVNVKISR